MVYVYSDSESNQGASGDQSSEQMKEYPKPTCSPRNQRPRGLGLGLIFRMMTDIVGV